MHFCPLWIPLGGEGMKEMGFPIAGLYCVTELM